MPKKRSSPPPEPTQPRATSARGQLFIAKLLCVRGGATASSPAAVDRIEGVLLLEKAVETALSAILDRLGGGSKEPAFSALWKAANNLVAKHTKWELPFKAGVDHLHHLRTGVQHHGLVPSREDGTRAAAIAYEFIREVASHVFQVDVDALALPEIVPDGEVAAALSGASTLLEQGDNGGSVKASAQAFQKQWSLIESAEARSMGAPIPDSDTRSLLHDYGDLYGLGAWAALMPFEAASLRFLDPLRAHFSKEQSAAIRALRRVLVEVATALLLGVEFHALRRFRAVVGKPPEDVTRDDAVFALNFALDSALRAEPSCS